MSASGLQAVILAAGRGRRLGAASDHLPKCLLPLAGRPMLAWSLQALRDCGVDSIRLVAGWQAEQLQPWGCDIVINSRWAETSVVRSLMQADAWLQRAPTLLMYGDGAYGRRALNRAIHAARSDLLVPGDRHWYSLWSRRFAEPLLDAESWRSHDGCLKEIGGRPRSADEVQAQFMGLLRITPTGWHALHSRLAQWERLEGSTTIDRMDMTAMLRRLLAEGVVLPCVEVDGGWVEIDTLADQDAVERGLEDADFLHDFR